MQWSELPGKRFGSYEVGEEIGRGGTSRVFRAFDHNKLRNVAIKIIPSDAEDKVEFSRRFRRETEIVKSLSHPNIVPVYDADETEEFVYHAMMLVQGGTLRQRAVQGMAPQEAAQYILQAARALHHAHLMGIVHRDVKSSNMLLPDDEPGKLMLTDFGTAKIQGARGVTRTGATIGTPEYMSPEQAEGREVDQRSDIYSLGCTLYEVLAGRAPFVGSTPVSVLYQQVHTQPTYIRSYNPAVPRELWTVIRTCLAKRPDDRYPSAERLAEELLPFAEGQIQATPAPWNLSISTRNLPNIPDRPTNRTLRAQSSGPVTPGGLTGSMTPNGQTLPPPYTPAATPIMPPQQTPQSGYTVPLAERGPNSQPGSRPGTQPGSQPGAPFGGMPPVIPPRQPRITVRLTEDPGAAPQTNPGGRFSPPSQPLERPSRTSGPIRPTAPSAPLNGAPPYIPGPRSAPPSGPQSFPPSGPRSFPPSGPYSLPPRGPQSIPDGDYGYTQGYRTPNSGPLSARLNAARPGAPSGPIRPTSPYPEMAFDAPPAVTTSVRSAPRSQPLASYRTPEGGEYRPGLAPLGRAPSSNPYRSAASQPTSRAELNKKNPRKRRRFWSILIVALIAAVLLSGALALGAAGIGALPDLSPRPTATLAPTATATLAPTATATATLGPTATSGPSQQQLLDQRAAASFSALFLSTGQGLYCSGGQSSFTSGEIVYVHLCLSGEGAPGPITATARSNGRIVQTIFSGKYLSPGTDYFQGHTFSRGSYDMLITVVINGKPGTAKDIPFTVS